MIGFGPSLCASSGSSAAPIWLGLLVATVGLFFLRRRA
jgi:MYXO-CTERM domain-containing protein